MSFWTRQKYARRVKKMFVHFGCVQNILVNFGRVENTVRLDKTLQLYQRIRCNIYVCNVANREGKQRKNAVFHSFYGYALFPLNICHFRRVQNERTYFRSIENIREYFERVQSAFKALLKSLKCT